MPSPIGHLLAGAAVGISLEPDRAPDRTTARRLSRFAAWSALIALAPDLDLVIPGAHRMATHGLGTTLLLMIVTMVVTGRVTGRVNGRWVLMVGAAHASHILLDWLGRDTRPPFGLEALWPFSDAFYISGWDVFPPTERRVLTYPWYTVVAVNARAALFELAVVGPFAGLAWWMRRKRGGPAKPDTTRNGRSRGRTSVRDGRRPPSAEGADTAGISGRPALRGERSGSRGIRRGR